MGQSLNLSSAPLILILLCVDIGPNHKFPLVHMYLQTHYLHKQRNYSANLCNSSSHNTMSHKRSELLGSVARHPFLLKEIQAQFMCH